MTSGKLSANKKELHKASDTNVVYACLPLMSIWHNDIRRQRVL